MPKVVSMTVPGEPEFIQVIKIAAGSAASLTGFDMEAVEDIEMAVAEAAKNITCHGSEHWCKCYDMIIQFKEPEMTIEIKASADCHTIKKNCSPCMDCPNEGNLGIAVIKSLMDKVEINNDENGNKSIIMVKNI
ncbi:MAG: ATP-binding protein [Anaerovoracaceae bacterium]